MVQLRQAHQPVQPTTVFRELERLHRAWAGALTYLMAGLFREGDPDITRDYFLSLVDTVRKTGGRRRAAFLADHAAKQILLKGDTADFVANLTESAELVQATNGARAGGRIEDVPGLLSLKTNTKYLLEPVLPCGAVVALTSESGDGKSLLGLNWAAEVLEDGISVLILDRENSAATAKGRQVDFGIPDSEHLRYWGGWVQDAYGNNMDAPQPDDPLVIAWVKACDPKPLVIVDSLSDFHGGDENDAGEMQAFIRRCKRLALPWRDSSNLSSHRKGRVGKRVPRHIRV